MSARSRVTEQQESSHGSVAVTTAVVTPTRTLPRKRIASALTTVHRDGLAPGARPSLVAACREQAEQRARLAAIAGWEGRWGTLPWEQASATVDHLTWQVTYAVEVADRDDH